MPRELSLFELDRELSRAVPRARAAQRALGSGREVTLSLPEALRDAETLERVASDKSDPIAPALLRWLYWLELVQRGLPLEGARMRRYRAERHALDTPLSGHFSWRELLGHALRDRARRQQLLAALLERGGELKDALARSHELRASLPSFGGRSRAELELPNLEITALAQDFLRDSADALGSLELSDFAAVLEQGLAHGADDGWPRQVSLRSLHQLIGEPSWLRDLKLDVGALPASIAPASFARGLLRLGSAFCEALASPQQPFVVTHDAFGLARATHGALFAGLLTSPIFLKRQLNLGSDRTSGHSRALGRSALLFVRQLALRVLLDAPALSGPRALGEAFAEHGSRAFGFELPPQAAGLFFRPRLGDAQRLCGAFLGALRAAELAEAHDEDWFRNPRAAEQLRAEARIPAAVTADSERLRAGASVLRRELTRHL